MVCLGSTSSTRGELLTRFGVKFFLLDGGFDEEQITQTNPDRFVYEATKGKLEGCLKKYSHDFPLICADTVVEVGGEIIRKPHTHEEAREVLQRQSGSTLSIRTCTMVYSPSFSLTDLSATFYTFAPFEHHDLETYLESGLWQGKAGGCMVEGFCKRYITNVQGLESTAMGLSVEKILPFLEKFSCH